MTYQRKTKPMSQEKKRTSQEKKRKHEDDEPNPAGKDVHGQSDIFKKLEFMTHCKDHEGLHCINMSGGLDNHNTLSHANLTLWAKKIVSIHFIVMWNVLTVM